MQRAPRQFGPAGLTAIALCSALGHANAQQESADEAAVRLSTLQQQIAAQTERLEALKKAVSEQQQRIDDIRRVLGLDVLAAQRGKAAAPRPVALSHDPAQVAQANPTEPAGQAPATGPESAAAPSQPVGQAPESEGRPRDVAPIFEQPGVLTPRGKAVIEPSLQYSYSSSNRVALVGYTIIPALTIGLIDVREVKRSSFIGTLTGRFGVTNRFEIEARLPYVYRSDDTVRRPLAGGERDEVFPASGHDIGDVEFTGRYQFNDGGADKPYYIGSLRLKTRTGKDPFEVSQGNTADGFPDGLQTELPTGSGFYGIQPALTVLYPSDPAVLFGTVSYLHSVRRKNVSQLTEQGERLIGTVEPGGIFGFNFGMGLALNEKSSFSIGYDHASVDKIKQNGATPAGAVRVQLGTLLLGYSYRLEPKRSLNVSLGVGVTRDTPDMTLTVRVPTTF